MGLRIYNTLTRQKEDFVPLKPGSVRMYVCGITPYASSHIGHARSAISFDVVFRWLKRSHLVTFVRNYTDLDDKIIKSANEAGEPIAIWSEKHIAQYKADMHELRCVVPNIEPRVTQHIPEIIELIARLEKKGVAYAVDGDVYFEVSKYPAYGQLSGRTLEELESGARVDVDPRKRQPHDFALWKAAKPGEPAWDSPWGKGRPGWHIECSAMAVKYLGEPFDLHGGGKDLVFPHHENEIAQSCAASDLPLLAKVWMHNGFVNLMPDACPKCGAELKAEAGQTLSACGACAYVLTEEDLKMSKSRGNFYPIRDVLSRFEGEALRYLMLMSSYRTPIQFSHTLLADTEKRLDKIYETLREMERFSTEQTFAPGPNFSKTYGFDPLARFAEAMDDDFNTAMAIADLSEVFKIANELIHGGEKERIGKMLSPADTSRLLLEIREIVRNTGDVLGLWQEDPKVYLERRKLAGASKLPMTPVEIEALIAERVEARKSKNFKRGDEIRELLLAKGIALKDTAKGTEWYAIER